MSASLTRSKVTFVDFMLWNLTLPPMFLGSHKYTVFYSKGCIFGKRKGNPHTDPTRAHTHTHT